MRYTQYRGLAQVTNWVKLKFAAMNLKKAGHLEMEGSVFIPWFSSSPVKCTRNPVSAAGFLDRLKEACDASFF